MTSLTGDKLVEQAFTDVATDYSFDILDNDPKYEKMYSCMTSILKFVYDDVANICINLLDEYFLK